jgi:hypothetical protein
MKARRLLAQAAGPKGTPVERIRSGLKPSPSILVFQDTKIRTIEASPDRAVAAGFRVPAAQFQIWTMLRRTP